MTNRIPSTAGSAPSAIRPAPVPRLAAASGPEPTPPGSGAGSFESHSSRRVAAESLERTVRRAISSFVRRAGARIAQIGSRLRSLWNDHVRYQEGRFLCPRCLELFNARPHRCVDAEWRSP